MTSFDQCAMNISDACYLCNEAFKSRCVVPSPPLPQLSSLLSGTVDSIVESLHEQWLPGHWLRMVTQRICRLASILSLTQEEIVEVWAQGENKIP